MADSVHVQSAFCLAFHFQLAVFSSLRDIPEKASLRKKYPYLELRWSAFFPHFSIFALNTQRYGVSLRIQSEWGKVREKGGPEQLRIWTLFTQSILLIIASKTISCEFFHTFTPCICQIVPVLCQLFFQDYVFPDHGQAIYSFKFVKTYKTGKTKLPKITTIPYHFCHVSSELHLLSSDRICTGFY